MNLIICTTPLQMLVAERIIIKNNLRSVVFIVISNVKNEKFIHYYNRVSKLASDSRFVKINKDNFINRIRSMVKLKYDILDVLDKNKIYDGCYIASIDSSYVQLVTSAIKYKALYTFDDGTINIIPNSIYYSEKVNKNLLERVFRNLFGIKENIQSYREKSRAHFTIFKGVKNIINNTVNIDLYTNKEIVDDKLINTGKTVKIFVGQILSEIEVSEERLVRLIESNNIDYYFPHPRETVKIKNVTYINTNKIFEDYLLSFISENNIEKLEIHTFFSTVLLTVMNIPNVKLCAYRTRLLEQSKKHRKVYDIFKKMNIEVKDIEL
ncbi:hypothetical protein A4G19_03185 [Pasteurellaceae bacterium Macca]|nr:hypothetical protein [Pasteurellaceae bacterium Macca]